MISEIKSLIAEPKKRNGAKRSSRWREFRKAHIDTVCAACGNTKNLQLHHILPFHEFPEHELDPENVITLCEGNPYENCHSRWGHRYDWKDYNPLVAEDAKWIFSHFWKLKKNKRERNVR